jgi:hypothetical protein
MNRTDTINALRATRAIDQSSVVAHNNHVEAIKQVEELYEILDGFRELINNDVVRVRPSDRDQFLQWCEKLSDV